MLNNAKGGFKDNPVQYINVQLMYYLGVSKSDLADMDDGEWAEHYAMLENIRTEQAKNQPFGAR